MQCCSNPPLNSDLSEVVTYNIPDFPVYSESGQLSLYPDFRAVSHWHDDFEFILILDGQMDYDINGHHVLLQTGEGIFVNSRCFHYGYSNTHTECIFLCILLSPSLFSVNNFLQKNYLEPIISNTHFPYQKLTPVIGWQNEIINDISSIYENNSGVFHPFIIIEKYAHILELLSENINPVSGSNTNEDDIRAISSMIGYVQKNYPDKIMLKDIFNAGNCSKTKCAALFKEYLSTSPMIYLSNYRLEKSCQLLRNTTLSVTEVAYACGFSGTSYFCELFRKNYGISPMKYRSQKCHL